MANRHLSRSIVLQTLFEWDFNGRKNEEIKVTLAKNIREFGPGLDDDAFIEGLVDLTLKKQTILDEIIQKAAPEWPVEKISVVDRNILRIGLAELLFEDRSQVPPKVAINEAIELAKSFGGENSGKFVNGVLGAVYREIGEPGKDETSKKKKNGIHFETDPEKMPVEKKAGAIVYTKKDGEFFIALVHDVFGYWAMAKGGIKEGEDEKEGAVREVKDEIGLDIEIKDLLGENEYIASHPEKGKIRKHVYYFLAESPYKELKLESTGGLDDAKWFSFTEIGDLKVYDDILPLLAKAIGVITSSN